MASFEVGQAVTVFNLYTGKRRGVVVKVEQAKLRGMPLKWQNVYVRIDEAQLCAGEDCEQWFTSNDEVVLKHA